MSIGSIGGWIGTNSSGSNGGLIGSSRGTQMLKMNEKLPSGRRMPTSPICTPFFRYGNGRLLFGSGIQRAQPDLFGARRVA